MSRTIHRLGSLLALLAMLAGCGSTPESNYYLLRARAADMPPTGAALSVGIGPISVPDYLQRNNMVFATGSNRMEVATSDRWGEPLRSGIERVLSLNLAALLQTQDVRSYPWHPARPPHYGVSVRVQELDAGADQASLVAEWLLYRPADDSPITRRITRLQESLSGSGPPAEEVARAYSELFFRLSEQLAAAIQTAEREDATTED